MKTSARRLAAVSLLFVLAGCGNKGPLVHPSAPAPEDATPAPADPTEALPSQDATPPADTGTPSPPVPAPPADDGAGNG